MFLGEFVLNNLPIAPRGATEATICFDIDDDGILKVSAEELTTVNKNGITITYSKQRISKEDTQRMLEDSKRYKDKDEEHTKKVDAYTALDNYDERIRKRLSGEDLTEMDVVVKKAKKWLDINEIAETNVIPDKKKELHWVWSMWWMKCPKVWEQHINGQKHAAMIKKQAQ
ncbi:heat shock cognate 70 kDa protein 2-like protein [Tanacetum coccineum]